MSRSDTGHITVPKEQVNSLIDSGGQIHADVTSGNLTTVRVGDYDITVQHTIHYDLRALTVR